MADFQYAKRWHTREDSGIRLDRQLRWFHDDEPVEHPRIIELFNQSLIPGAEGKFELHIGNDWCFVTVEDAAYGVTNVDPREDGSVYLRLSDRTAERLDLGSLETDGEGVLTCRVKDARAKARFTRDAQFAFGELLEEENGKTVLVVGMKRTPLELGGPGGPSPRD